MSTNVTQLRCTVGGPSDPCGDPIVAAIAVHTFPDVHVAVDGQAPTPGVALLCRRHAVQPLIDPGFLDAAVAPAAGPKPPPAAPEPPMPTGQAFLDHYSTPGLTSPETPPEREGPCIDCGRPFTPTHDINAPGPNVRHPFRPNRHPDGAR